MLVSDAGRHYFGGFALVSSLIAMAAANAPPAVDLATVGLKADSAYQAKDWATASALYQELSSAQPDSFLNWLRLGASLHEIGRNDTALKALEKARKAGAPPSTVHYQLARIESSRGNRGAALDSLEQAVGQGRGRPDLILAEVDFQPLRSDPRFVKLVADAKKNDAPCQYRAENRQFDFWLGNWAVTTTQEHTPVGRSHIESTIGGCVIWENWTSLSESGYTGKSYNIYNIEQKRWEQFWVDNQGGMIHFLGSSNAGVMDFHTADIPQADGSVLQRHLRFYSLPTGQVRQLSEGSTDSGRTWSVEYDFTYSRSE